MQYHVTSTYLFSAEVTSNESCIIRQVVSICENTVRVVVITFKLKVGMGFSITLKLANQLNPFPPFKGVENIKNSWKTVFSIFKW